MWRKLLFCLAALLFLPPSLASCLCAYETPYKTENVQLLSDPSEMSFLFLKNVLKARNSNPTRYTTYTTISIYYVEIKLKFDSFTATSCHSSMFIHPRYLISIENKCLRIKCDLKINPSKVLSQYYYYYVVNNIYSHCHTAGPQHEKPLELFAIAPTNK